MCDWQMPQNLKIILKCQALFASNMSDAVKAHISIHIVLSCLDGRAAKLDTHLCSRVVHHTKLIPWGMRSIWTLLGEATLLRLSKALLLLRIHVAHRLLLLTL